MKVFKGLLLMFVLCSTLVTAQNGPDGSLPQGENLQVPEGWQFRFDKPSPDIIIGSRPDSSDIYFVNMTPGWHLTSGPAGIYYHPENIAEGEFKLSSTMYLFDTKGRDREGFGIFIGGNNLDEPEQEYLYFLIRNTGDYLIKSRKGEETSTIQAWTPAESMNRFTEESDGSEKNEFMVEVKNGMLHFSLNGESLFEQSVGEWKTSGHYGLRVNHSVNLHISGLEVNAVK